MMSEEDTGDKELLELAAKAAGIEDGGGFSIWKHGREWDPLDDSGDAFDLAVQLKMDLTFYERFVRAGNERREYENDDPCAVTRRAIVRAAAEIGKVKCFL